MNKRLLSVPLVAASLLAAADAHAAPTCGQGWVEYWGWVCHTDGSWQFDIVGREDYGERGALQLEGIRTNCISTYRAVGGGGENEFDCLHEWWEVAIQSDCDIPQGAACEPWEMPDPESDTDEDPWYPHVPTVLAWYDDVPKEMDPKTSPKTLDGVDYGWWTPTAAWVTK